MAAPGKYKDSLNLPQTDFPMKAELARREPELLARWKSMDLYRRIQEHRAGAPLYLLHDGPPYSNGHIHYGHILNKILKDLVVKYRTMAGYRAPYVPGWDTHGLPIELAVDRELGARKRQMSATEVRAACRDHAMKFVAIQREEFERLGVFGAWDRPYLTLDPGYEAAIVRALAAFARKGLLYRGKKPVYWCPSDRTALAEAEIEYADHTSPSIYVRFPLEPALEPASLEPRLAGSRLALVIWTTTPWTLPANLAIVLHPELDYVAVPHPRDPGEHLVVARDLAEGFLTAIGGAAEPDRWIPLDRAALGRLEGASYQHPLIAAPRGAEEFQVWFADYVTTEQGTGLVHTAPGHGADDYRTGIAHGLEPYAPLDDAGRYTDEVPEWLRGRSTREANPAIVARLHDTGFLLNPPGDSVRHSYPHCWRCKGPILFRATPQWFVGIDLGGLRDKALAAIEATEWVPPWGENRIHGMIANRPDWCISRQRLWGVPIPAFYCEGCGTATADPAVMEHVADIFARDGADAWFSRSAVELVPPGTSCPSCGGAAFRAEKDIVDVWFESGASWLAVCENDPALGQVDLYLEGSDQHRGWFHSSLLVGIAVKERAPYKTVLTHGFVLDETGKPYSKSDIEKARAEGKKIRFIPPDEVIGKFGAELFRLWVASTEFRNDIPYSQTILDGLADWYRKFRNTCRFLLGNLSDFVPDQHPLERATLGELDRQALLVLEDLIARVRAAYDAFEFHVVYRLLVDYTAELSATYLDVVKDRLYTEPRRSPARRGCQAVLHAIASALARLAAPILCFTAEEVWQHLPRRVGEHDSVHMSDLPEGAVLADDAAERALWATLAEYRAAATAALEPFRQAKHKSTDARVVIAPRAADRALLAARLPLLAELFIVSEVAVGPDDAPAPAIAVEHAAGSRCARCWRWFAAMSAADPALCPRCAAAVAEAAA
jgi:isoleucyl-tRNA synthetase